MANDESFQITMNGADIQLEILLKLNYGDYGKTVSNFSASRFN